MVSPSWLRCGLDVPAAPRGLVAACFFGREVGAWGWPPICTRDRPLSSPLRSLGLKGTKWQEELKPVLFHCCLL